LVLLQVSLLQILWSKVQRERGERGGSIMSEEKRGENGQPKPVEKDLASLEAVLSVAAAFGAPNPMKVDSQ
jgi:hypothetical protein